MVEVITPRTNLAGLSSAENLFAAVALAEPFSVEIAADQTQRQFLFRTPDPTIRSHLESQLSAAYPQAEFRQLEADADPARCRSGEQLACCTFTLRGPSYLPVRTFTDLEIDGERAAQADPVLGILTALSDLPVGWRGLSQLILEPAPEDWCRNHLRLAVQHPLEHERVARSVGGGAMLAFLAMLLGVLAVGLQGWIWLRSGQWPLLAGLVALSLVTVGLMLLAVKRLSRPRVYDMDLVRDKLSRVAYRAELRLAVFAPETEPRVELEGQLLRVAAAYRRYALSGGNSFVPQQLRSPVVDLRAPLPVGRHRKRLTILTALEIAGVWHLPHAAADVAFVERTTARRWLPLPPRVADGCHIGASAQQGRHIPVAVPADVLSRHALLVAKTRRGKSTLMLRLAHHLMHAEPRQAMLLLDPHRDLAVQAIELVPETRAGDVVWLDVANCERPFGLNLLDVGLGWDRDRAVANTLVIFQREWGDRFWGPRMEDAFRFALLTLFEANQALCTQDPLSGRASQYTLLEVPALLSDPGFRRMVLTSVTDPSVKSWWSDYFDPLERRFRQEIINPILSKVHRFEGSRVARSIVGQPASSIDPQNWVRDGNLVIVNTARGSVGENAAALIGSTLVNLAALAVAGQARLEPRARGRITIFVDEFHTIPGADYEAILAELGKYGANLVLATQSLARLLALGGDQGLGLRSTGFANIDGLFAFNCSAEDAEYLVPELGGAIVEQDLVELSEHQCYARLSCGGQRLPTFFVRLDPPLQGEAAHGARLAVASAQRLGRPVELVAASVGDGAHPPGAGCSRLAVFVRSERRHFRGADATNAPNATERAPPS